jgi:hypothetical protein
MNNFDQNPSPSILDGADDIFSNALRLPELYYQFGRKSLCIEFAKRGAIQFDALELVEKLYKRVSDNWNKRVRRKDPSLDNWNLRHVISEPLPINPELHIERQIVRDFPDEWWNQMPTASGLVCSHERKRSIDLVHKVGNGDYDLVELKYESNHPLYAAREILLYGMLYLHARIELKERYYLRCLRPVLNARSIQLRVLAPSIFYTFRNQKGGERISYDLAWLEESLSSGLFEYARQHAKNPPNWPTPHAEINFQFLQFNNCFQQGEHECTKAGLEDMLKTIAPVYRKDKNKE